MRRHHAMSPGCSGHYQGLRISSSPMNSSACNFIISVVVGRTSLPSLDAHSDNAAGRQIYVGPGYGDCRHLVFQLLAWSAPGRPPSARVRACHAISSVAPELARPPPRLPPRPAAAMHSYKYAHHAMFTRDLCCYSCACFIVVLLGGPMMPTLNP